jgi:AcrR family transcriptional regulator
LSDREIVRVAREIIADVGVEAFTIRRLSNELGVALGATYHHVPTKHELLVLVARDLYDDVVLPAQRASWEEILRTAALNLSSVVGRHPGMASFMMANYDTVLPERLQDRVQTSLVQAGFSRRGSAAVMASAFFFVIGMSAGGFRDPSSLLFQGRTMQAMFEDGLDVLLAGARARLTADRRASRARA